MPGLPVSPQGILGFSNEDNSGATFVFMPTHSIASTIAFNGHLRTHSRQSTPKEVIDWKFRSSTQRHDLMSFSAFAQQRNVDFDPSAEEEKSTSIISSKIWSRGDHVALVCEPGNTSEDASLYSMIILRCDTWSVVWAVSLLQRERALFQPVSISLLNSSMLFGFGSEKMNEKNLAFFVAYQRAFKKRSSKVRTFTAHHKVFLLSEILRDGKAAFGEGEIPISTIAASTSSCFVVTSLGNIFEIFISIARDESEAEVSLSAHYISSIPSYKQGDIFNMVSLQQSESGQTSASTLNSPISTLAFYRSSGTGGVHMLSINRNASQFSPQWISIKCEAQCSILSVDLVYCASTTTSYAFVQLQQNVSPFSIGAQCSTLVPSSDGLIMEAVSHPSVFIPTPSLRLVASYFDTKQQAHTLVCSSSTRTKFFEQIKAGSMEEKTEGSVSYPESWMTASIPFSEQEGRYAVDDANRITWSPLLQGSVVNPHGKGSKEEDVDWLLSKGSILHLAEGGAASTMSLVKLTYPLTTISSSGPEDNEMITTNMELYSVTVPAGLHAKLAKQWHNANHGMEAVVRAAIYEGRSDSESFMKGNTTPLSLLLQYHWHPKHLRRVLKWLNGDDLRALLDSSCGVIGAASHLHTDTPITWYYKAATSATELALQLIMIARQKGLPVYADDTVRHLIHLLRAGRAIGHPLRRVMPKIELMVESARQERLLQAFLRDGTSQTSDGSERDLYAIRSVLESTSRAGGATLRRYAPHGWVQPLEERQSEMAAVAAAANAYLLDAQLTTSTSSSQHADYEVPNWEAWGKQPHRDRVLKAFESGLLQTAA